MARGICPRAVGRLERNDLRLHLETAMTTVPASGNTPDAEQQLRDALALVGLTRDNERAVRALKDLIERAGNAERESAQAAREARELRKDAERYRYIKMDAFQPFAIVNKDMKPITEEEADAAIDAALERSK